MLEPLKTQICEILLGLQGYFATKIATSNYNGKSCIEIHIRNEKNPRCPQCGNSAPVYDLRTRRILHTAISCCLVVLVLTLHRTKCPKCGIKTESQDITEGNNRHSKLLGKLVTQFSSSMSNASIARIFGVNRSTIYRIDKYELEKQAKTYSELVPPTEKIAIDEIGYKRRHKYATVLTNHEDGRVIDISVGKSKESAKELFKKYDRRLQWLDTVTMDFSNSYISAVSEWWGTHLIVFDRFHFSRLVNRKIEELRREIQRDFEPALLKRSKKKDRWLVLTRKHNHKDLHQNRLEQLRNINKPLYEAYLLKEDLLSIFEESINYDDAKVLLQNWCSTVSQTKFNSFKVLSRTILKRLHIILNWFRQRVTNAKAEAVNNVIRTIIKRAYGIKDFQYFRLKILQCCGYLKDAIST